MAYPYACQQPPDVIEALRACSRILAVGTYLLDKETGRKTGSLCLLHAAAAADPAAAPLTLLAEVATDAVFDAAWCALSRGGVA